VLFRSCAFLGDVREALADAIDRSGLLGSPWNDVLVGHERHRGRRRGPDDAHDRHPLSVRPLEHAFVVRACTVTCDRVDERGGVAEVAVAGRPAANDAEGRAVPALGERVPERLDQLVRAGKDERARMVERPADLLRDPVHDPRADGQASQSYARPARRPRTWIASSKPTIIIVVIIELPP
jgi:hypothetical protein